MNCVHQQQRSIFALHLKHELRRNSSSSSSSNNRFRQQCSNEVLSRHMTRERILGSRDSFGTTFCLKLNHDGTKLATGAADCTLHIWDVDTGKKLHALAGHREIITSIAWVHPTAFGITSNVGDDHDDSNMSIFDAYNDDDNDVVDDDGNNNNNNRHNTSSSTTTAFFTASLDKSIRLWRDYKQVACYLDHNDWLRCIALSGDNLSLVSGCVSSSICGWDVQTGQVTFRINRNDNSQDDSMNTINSLQFGTMNHNIFVSGSRDGRVRIWDKRDTTRPVMQYTAHLSKLNNVQFASDDICLLSGGRDNALRLWDTRKIMQHDSAGAASNSHWGDICKSGMMVREYRGGHTCTAYNVICSFYNHENHIITGSEDRCIYIYDRHTGKVINNNSSSSSNNNNNSNSSNQRRGNSMMKHSSAVHLVDTAVQSNSLRIVSSSIDTSCVSVWSPRVLSAAEELEEREQHRRQAVGHMSYQQFVEDNDDNNDGMGVIFMTQALHKYGDRILRLFHRNNSTLRHGLDSLLTDSNSAERQELISIIREMTEDFRKAHEQLQQQQQPAVTTSTGSTTTNDDDDNNNNNNTSSAEAAEAAEAQESALDLIMQLTQQQQIGGGGGGPDEEQSPDEQQHEQREFFGGV